MIAKESFLQRGFWYFQGLGSVQLSHEFAAPVRVPQRGAVDILHSSPRSSIIRLISMRQHPDLENLSLPRRH
jgi:hypothetical protein